MPKTPAEIFQEKLKFLAQAESDLLEAVIAHEKLLYEAVLSEYLPLFEIKDGILLDTPANERLILQLDTVFAKLEKTLYRDILGPMVENILKGVVYSSEYFESLGFKKSVINALLKDKITIESKLGITPTGRLRKDSYLYNLGKTAQVREDLKKYVLSSLTGDKSFLDYQLGLRNLVIGNKRVKGLATNGALHQYFDKFAVDTYAQVDAMVDKQFANELGLKHFIYEGSVIKTSRPFCEKRAGKAFTVKETQNWKDDPDLIDKKTKNTYNPLIDRGRYRCRHAIRYITEPLYKELTK